MMRRTEQLLGRHFGAMRSMQGSHCHVATSPRRNVWSTNAEVNIAPRRDVNSKICISSLNARRLGIFRVLKNVRPETQNFRTCNTDFKDLFGFLYWFFFIVLIIFGSHEDVIHITYFVSFLHDVLNLFLGLHQTLSQTMD